MITTCIPPFPVCIDVLVYMVEFLPQASMAKLATISRRLEMLMCSCNEKASLVRASIARHPGYYLQRDSLIATEKMNRPLARIQREAIDYYRQLNFTDPTAVTLYGAILLDLERPGSAGAWWNGDGLSFTVEWDVVKQLPGLVGKNVNSLRSTMWDHSTNGKAYFMQMGTPIGGQATYHFNYIPCYECHFNGARQFDCGIAEHDGGTRPV